MIFISCVLLFLGIKKKFEPLLLVPIAIGMLVTNLPGSGMFHEILFAGGHVHWDIFQGEPITASFLSEMFSAGVSADVLQPYVDSLWTTAQSLFDADALNQAAAQIAAASGDVANSIAVQIQTLASAEQFAAASGVTLSNVTVSVGLIDVLYLGIKLGIYPCLIFMGVGAMTDFGPLIANPKSLLLGAAAQLGIFMTFVGCRLMGFSGAEASSVGIIGGADGPTAIFVTALLAPALLGPIAVSAYSYMALVPVIQPPIMKALTTEKERQIVMKPLRQVSKKEKIFFPVVVTVFVALLVPSAAPLIACLMLGNLAKECGVLDRLSKTMQNELMNIVTIFLGISVGATATAATFLSPKTLAIMGMGVVAFGFGTAGGVLLAKFMNLFLKEKINPLIGSAGVSAVPMAARVSQKVGQQYNPGNFLLMHAMGPNVAGVIGSAIAAGVLISLYG
ncbi:MAG: sodium ion-translocating decarboxylase subunit beta [Oscillospiraceae bacterium]|nr:sodium ion-translocating decarboxylase subunit beta [Oscillospiraceae bacterium]